MKKLLKKIKDFFARLFGKKKKRRGGDMAHGLVVNNDKGESIIDIGNKYMVVVGTRWFAPVNLPADTTTTTTEETFTLPSSVPSAETPFAFMTFGTPHENDFSPVVPKQGAGSVSLSGRTVKVQRAGVVGGTPQLLRLGGVHVTYGYYS